MKFRSANVGRSQEERWLRRGMWPEGRGAFHGAHTSPHHGAHFKDMALLLASYTRARLERACVLIVELVTGEHRPSAGSCVLPCELLLLRTDRRAGCAPRALGGGGNSPRAEPGHTPAGDPRVQNPPSCLTEPGPRVPCGSWTLRPRRPSSTWPTGLGRTGRGDQPAPRALAPAISPPWASGGPPRAAEQSPVGGRCWSRRNPLSRLRDGKSEAQVWAGPVPEASPLGGWGLPVLSVCPGPGSLFLQVRLARFAGSGPPPPPPR